MRRRRIEFLVEFLGFMNDIVAAYRSENMAPATSTPTGPQTSAGSSVGPV
jgi:hypothetical protein